MISLDLPEPSDSEKQHSAQLLELIRAEIEQADGWIDFSRYMALALYAPGLGYYSAGLHKFGSQGDFITAPELSPLFAQTLAKPVAQVLQQLTACCVIEFGAGSGVLAADILKALQAQGCLPDHYYIIELSAELKQRQQQTLQHYVPDLIERVQWLSALPDEKKLNAVVLANEVLDAMPVNRFLKKDQQVQALGVSLDNDQLVLSVRPASQALCLAIGHVEDDLGYILPDDYSSEINMSIQPWLQSLSAMLDQGAVYLIDYGYSRKHYYAPDRIMGTYMGYYKHRAFDQPLWYPGLQDMTAFVDFTAVAEAAIEAGFEIAGYTTQAHFLMDAGIMSLVEQLLPADEKKYLHTMQQFKRLTMPSEMGERFKVMGLDLNLDEKMPGFELKDLRATLE